jgi:hypothetical protein
MSVVVGLTVTYVCNHDENNAIELKAQWFKKPVEIFEPIVTAR